MRPRLIEPPEDRGMVVICLDQRLNGEVEAETERARLSVVARGNQQADGAQQQQGGLRKGGKNLFTGPEAGKFLHLPRARKPFPTLSFLSGPANFTTCACVLGQNFGCTCHRQWPG